MKQFILSAFQSRTVPPFSLLRRTALSGRIMSNKVKKLAFGLPFLATLSLTSVDIDAAAFDVTVTASVSTTCSLSSTVGSLSISGGITNTAGKLDANKDLPLTQVASVNCNGPATVQLTAETGFFKSNTETGTCPSSGSATCLQYDAKLNLGLQNTPLVNANGKTQSFNTSGAVTNGLLKLNMDLVGPTSDILPSGTFSEKFTITVTAL